MEIRRERPGDEHAQAEVYNAAAAGLPGFKPASAEEIARRARGGGGPARFCAVEGGRVVGYVAASPNGRVSAPWCLPGAEAARDPLLETALADLARRGVPEAWAAYRADWRPVLDVLADRGFVPARTIINFVAPLGRLPRTPLPDGRRIADLNRRDLPRLAELLGVEEPGPLESAYWEDPDLATSSLFALKDGDGRTCGVGLAIVDPRFADPTSLDAAMPCFRLGAFGTERERHKRVNGLVSCLFEDASDGAVLLTEAARRLDAAGLAHAAAQAPSDRPRLVALYDRHFERQGSFPILARRLSPP